MRAVYGQKALLGRTMHAIEYDAIHDEFVVPQQFAQAILTFEGGADGQVAPIRVIQGPKTKLMGLSRLALDPVNDEIFVPQGNLVLVYPRLGNGDVPPKRILQANVGGGGGAGAVAVDPVNDVLVVSGRAQSGPHAGRMSLSIYNRTDEGNTAPMRVIIGPNTGMISLGGPFRVYPPKGRIIVSIRGGTGETLASDKSFVGIWSIEDDGDVPPQWTIGGPNAMLVMPRGIALDPKNKNLIVSDKRLNAVLTYYFPEMF